MNHNKSCIQLPHEHAPSKQPKNLASPSATSSNGSEGVFDFFGLPRELRDKIYEQPVLMEHQRLPVDTGEDFLMKAKKLRTSLLLICHQFKREYSERCDKQQMLCLRDYWGVIPSHASVAVRDKAER